MDQSANLQLPYIMPSQAQKHVTHNEAIRTLDALVHLAVLDRDLSAPPGSAADGDRYLVAAGGSGAWASKDDRVAAWQDGAWAFLAPKAGWLLRILDEDRLISFDGAAWMDAAVHSVNPVPLVGVNTNADATNRLAVRSPASLFDQEAGDHRIKVNKAAAGNTASLVFQSGYSGRAEFGLAGDDDWHVKVSPDGIGWTEALKVDRTTGRVSLPAALPLGDENQVVARRHVRELLAANRTYYVRTDGSDSNNGLANTSGGAFLTVQKALDAAARLDFSGFKVTISVGAGTFSGRAIIPLAVGQTDVSKLEITGVGATTILTSSGAFTNATVYCGVPGAGATIANVKVQNTIGSSQGCALNVENSGQITIGSTVEIGATGWIAARAATNGVLKFTAGATVSGDATNIFGAQFGGYIEIAGTFALGTRTVTQTAAATNTGVIFSPGGTSFTGTVTGSRYSASANGVLNTSAGGASFFPGSSAGATSSGGQYS